MLWYFKLAFSVFFAATSLLLLGLWVRSYWWVDFVDVPLPGTTKFVGIALIPGHVWWLFDEGPATWRLESSTIDEYTNAAKAAMSDAYVAGFAKGFRFESSIGWMPYWCLLLLTALFAAAPWIKWKYSLRTLLIITTLIAVLLATIVLSK